MKEIYQQIKDLNEERSVVEEHLRTINEQLAQLEVEFINNCTHTYDDGTSAKNDGFIMTVCKICGWDNY